MPERGAVAFVGLGNMGFPMVSRLVADAWTVRGFDVSPEARARIAGIGAESAATAGDAVRGARTVILMLPNSAIVTSVLDELLSGHHLSPGTTVVDMSSSEPSSTRQLAERLETAGIALVDAPVSGGVTGAVNGKLTIMVGGDPAVVDDVEPVLAVLGSVVRCGTVGAGHAIKALNNLLSATHLWATSEAMEAGAAFGLDPDVMLAVFNRSSGRSGSTENKWPNFVLPGGYDSGFGLRLMVKDMKIALQLHEGTGVAHDMAARAVQLWEAAADGLEPAADHTEIARWVAGLGKSRDRTTAAPDPAVTVS